MEVNNMSLKDKVVIVTGGTRGIGLATVKEFLKEENKVIFCGSKKESVEKAHEELLKEFPNGTFEGIYPDLTNYESVKADFNKVLAKYGSIDVLVNNAGISDNLPFVKYTDEHFLKVMNVNVLGVYNCSRAVVDAMIAANSGVIINTSSIVYRDAMPSGIAYPTSKFAVNGFTLALARELAGKNIRVNAVAPGVTYTDMMRAVPEEYIKPMIAGIPLHRLGQPEDIAHAIVFLASDKASYISGQVLHVDGLARS